MCQGIRKKALTLAAIPISFLAVQYLLPLTLPFLLGALFRCARPSGVPRGPATSTGSLAFRGTLEVG